MAGWSHRTGDEWRLTLNCMRACGSSTKTWLRGCERSAKRWTAFGATLPPTATLNDKLEIITRAIHVIGKAKHAELQSRTNPNYARGPR